MGLPAFGNIQRGLTCAEMIDEVQALTGTTDPGEPIATEDRITVWLNDGQREIIHKTPGVDTVAFKNTTSLDITQSLAYEVNDITGGDFTTQDVARIYDVYYLDGPQSRRLHFLTTDEFDKILIDPTHSSIPFGKAKYWTRRGGQIEIIPLSQCAYVDKDLRFDGEFYARDLTTDSTQYSDISRSAHVGLIYYAVAEYYGAAKDKIESEIWKRKFSVPSHRQDQQGWLEDFADFNNNMQEWDGDLFFE